MSADQEYLDYQNALYEALAGASGSLRDSSPVLALDRATAVAITASNAAPVAVPLLTSLADIAAENSLESAIAIARDRFATARAFQEAIYCARCLGRDGLAVVDLMAGRAYVETAAVPPAYAELATDQRSILDVASFEALWAEPGRLTGMSGVIELWQRDYLSRYLPAHTAYNEALGRDVEQIDAMRTTARALERLNGLRRLGPPLALQPLERLSRLSRLFPCTLDANDLRAALANQPTCPQCSFALGAESLSADLRQVARAVQDGLATQQARLARQVVSRLLREPVSPAEGKLGRFIDVVQASDLTGLAGVLDDELLAFLDDLLATDDPSAGVLDRLARAYPEVTPSNLEAAVSELRRLLLDQLGRSEAVRLRTDNGDQS